jgi:hypothetical protein
MKKFSELKIRKINEDANLPDNNYEEMSKEDLVKMLQGQKNSEKESQSEVEEENVNVEEKPEILGEGSNPSKFFSKLFESREMAHIYHLQVNGEPGSHAKHTALGDYYDGVLGFIDDIIEIWQGQYGIIEEYDVIDTKETSSKDTIEYFNELARFIKEERKCIPVEDTHLHNIVDEVVALVYKTLYKLKYNK